MTTETAQWQRVRPHHFNANEAVCPVCLNAVSWKAVEHHVLTVHHLPVRVEVYVGTETGQP